MEETITMTEILARIVRSWKSILITALAVAVLLGGFQAYRVNKQVSSPDNTTEAIEARYQAALETYKTEKDNLTKSLEDNQAALTSKEEYAADSLLMAIDPYNEYTTSIIVGFTDINGDGAVQGVSQYQQTGANYLVETIRGQYVAMWQNMNLPEDLELPAFAAIDSKYLSEVLSVENMTGGLLSIRAVGTTATDTEALATAVYRYLQGHQSAIASSSFAHTLTLVNQTTKNMVDESLVTKHTTLETEIQSLNDTIKSLESQLEELKEPTKENAVGSGDMIKGALKYAVLGVILGIILACFWVCCLCVFGNRVGSTRQLERVIDACFLGSLAIPKTVMDIIANRLAGERSWRDCSQSKRYVCQRVKALNSDAGPVLIVSTLIGKSAVESTSTLSMALQDEGYQVSILLDAIHNPDVVKALDATSGVVLAEMLDKSDLVAVQDLTSQVRTAGKTVLGFVMI